MSEPKLISPLLDGFVMGPPISSHHGVRCCPAMRHNSDNKYIVKIISVPASQSQLDALLLTGAYKDPGEAMDYFKSLAEDITEEADLLLKVSKLEGFLPYEGHQIVPMEDNRLGYLIYLVGSYKRSLDKYIRRNPEAAYHDVIKLGLDLCTALSACRRAGSVYIALKPTNIFLSDDKEFRIGDLGFVSFDSLKYMSLPGKFRSPYCPPEILDPMQTLNETIDTYALGMVLYQLCNGGKLPASPQDPTESFPLPAYGDEKLREVIMKAISPDINNRFRDPVEMGQAIVACIPQGSQHRSPVVGQQASGISHDTQVFSTEAVNEAAAAKIHQDTRGIPTNQILKSAAVQPASTGEALSDTRILSGSTVKESVMDHSTESILETTSANTRVIPTAAVREAVSSDKRIIPAAPSTLPSAPKQAASPIRSAVPTESSLSISQETKVMAAVAAPSASVAPSKSAPISQSYKSASFPDTYDEFDDEDEDDGDEEVIRSIPAVPHRMRKPIGKSWIIWLVIIGLLCAVGYVGYYYYSNYYLQTVDSMTISGVHDHLTVTIVTQTDESLLTVTCADTYGNSIEKKLSDGKAEFTDLLPNSQYKITLEIEGFHQLVGKTSDVFNTESRTEIVSFTGIAGAEDGSVMLTFTVDGPEPEKWILTYSAEGEDPMIEEFTGHSITIRNLAFPKVYTFQLSPSEDLYLTGQTSMEFTTSSLIMAKNLTITACDGDEMTVRWDQPSEATVDSWTVRCYSDGGYDQTIETSENKAVFSQIDPSYVYYVEVTADGMTQPARTSVTADPITITGLKVDESDLSKLTINWDFLGESPDGGWLLMYSLDGTNTQSVVKCAGSSAEIAPRIHGAEYKFVIQAADSTSIFSNIHTYRCPEAEEYNDHSFDTSKTTAYLLVTPDKKDWTGADVTKNDYADSFKAGESISILLFCDSRFYIPSDEIFILYVIRNSDGQVVSSLVSQATDDWHDLWVAHNTNYGELNLSSVPTETGSYTLSIYFNGKFIASADFSITE